MNTIKTILADEQPIFLRGLESTLLQTRKPSFEIVASVSNGDHLITLVESVISDLLILDLSLKGKDGLEVIREIRSLREGLPILVLSSYKKIGMVKSTLQAGADGYLLKTSDTEELISAIQQVCLHKTFVDKAVSFGEEKSKNGLSFRSFEDKFVKKYYLTKRELEILRLITQAMSNKEIAKKLFISDQTVGVHRKNIMRKIGVSNTAGLIKTAYDYCLV
ncbi:MAG: response regulator transcription factor [Bacteroidota bacterium]